VEIRPAPLASFRGGLRLGHPPRRRASCRTRRWDDDHRQKPWETVEADVAAYREPVPEINGEEAPNRCCQLCGVHRAERPAERCSSGDHGYSPPPGHYEFANQGLAEIPGYEYYGKLAQRIAKHGPEDFARFLAGSRCGGRRPAVTGAAPENVRRIDECRRGGVFNYAGMPTTSPRPTSAASPNRSSALHAIDNRRRWGG